MADLLTEESVVQRLREHSIAIQLYKDSSDAQLFAQLCKCLAVLRFASEPIISVT